MDADAEALRDIAIRAFEEDRVKYGAMPPGIESLEWHTSKIRNGLYYKIASEGKIVGGINLYDLGDGHFRLGAIFIDPAYQNRGIGSKAIRFIESKHADVKKWSLDTPYQNYSTHAFYKKHGYVKVGEIQPMKDVDFWLFEFVKG